MLVIDTLARAMAGSDENSASDVSLVVAKCEAITMAAGAAILLVHHSGKDTSKGARGSTALKQSPLAC